ncbi:DNA-directed RNA polymerase III subunit RPC4-like isoform X1 [Rhizophagus clarus]|uniref:DNA-directed RNA polymerase III subunit RPC4-like isoform X1 n=1 Tax=Rhizophagus clarus TaxID=94130 RepID=A0A8H3MAN5_9GLOM|nr:DNA-directed RNA polymerase III subunit RPC4-like isoform X1 [Rhizophagus clarus]
MADEAIESQATPKRGRGRPRGVRSTTRSRTTVERQSGATRGRGRGRGRGRSASIEDEDLILTETNRTLEHSRPDINMDLGSEINHPMSPQLSRAPSPTPSLASISSGRRLGSLSHDLPAPGRLASVRTAPTGHYFLSTSSRVTLRGTQKKIFVPTVPEAHRRPQPTITADAITPELFCLEDNEPFTPGLDSSGRGIDRGRGTRGRGRFMPDLVASGPFAFGSNANIQPLDSTNVFSTSIIEERKNRTDNAEDFDSFREDPWAPDMLLVEHEKEDTAGILEGKDLTDDEKSKGIKRKLTHFNEENHLLCFQLPTILPEFEPSKRSKMNGSNDKSSHLDKGKSRGADKLGTGSPLIQLPLGQGKGKEREQDNAGDIINCNKPEGQIGRLVMRRSGKMQMILGDFTFDVIPGLDRTFLENAVVIDPSQESVFNLGQITQHLVVKPNISSLLNDI